MTYHFSRLSILATLGLTLSLLACEKAPIAPNSADLPTTVSFRSDPCTGPVAATLMDDGQLLPTLNSAEYDAMWGELGARLESLAPGGGGGALHDFTIWPTTPLQEQGFGGHLGIEITLTETLLTENPELWVSAEAAAELALEPLDGGQWAPVIVAADGSITPTPLPDGWSLRRVQTSIGFGLVVVTEENFAPAPSGFGFVIVPDDFQIDGAPYQAQNYGGIIVVVEDIVGVMASVQMGVIIGLEDITAVVGRDANLDDMVTGIEDDFSLVRNEYGGILVVVEDDESVYGAISGTGSVSYGEIILIEEDVFALSAPRLSFLTFPSGDDELRMVSVYLDDCGGGHYSWPVL